MKFTEEYVICAKKHVLDKKMFRDWLVVTNARLARVEKTAHVVETH